MPKEKENKSPTMEELETIVKDDAGPETVADTLREAMAEQEAENAGDEDSDDEEEKASESEDATKGKAAEDEQDDDEDEDEEKSKKAKDETDADEDAGDKGTEVLEPPAEWSPDDHKVFHEMTPEGQKFVLGRVGAAAKIADEGKEVGAKTAWIEELADQEVGQGVTRRQYWERNGWDPKRAVSMILSLADHAQSNPVEFIRNLARDRNIDLSELIPKAADTGAELDADDPYSDDPVVQTLRAELSDVREAVAAMKGETTKVTDALAQRDDEAKAAYNQKLDGRIETFKAETGDDGKLKHPHFEEVKPYMGALITGGVEPDMESAYKSACRAHPAVSTKIEYAHKAQLAREREEDQRKKAAKARKTGSSVTGETDTTAVPASTGDLRKDMRRLADEAGIFS